MNASNIFSKYNTYDNSTTTSTFISWSKSKSPNRYYGINISWRFGELKAQVKKAARSISSKQLYKEALNHTFDEPKQWEIREINEIMNQCITGWNYFPIRGCLRNTADKRAGSVKSRNGHRQPARKIYGRFCGGHRADGASILKMTARCRLRCYPVAEPVDRGKSLISGLFPSLTTKTTRK